VPSQPGRQPCAPVVVTLSGRQGLNQEMHHVDFEEIGKHFDAAFHEATLSPRL
jgi:hypothetical protein